jgi:Transglycosylase SLT domain/SPOR domain
MRRVITSAFFLGLVFSDALFSDASEALGAAMPHAAYKSVADTMRAAAGHGTPEIAARSVAQNTRVPDSDPRAAELERAETTTPPAFSDPACQTLESAAQANDLPLEFLTRLIWQESRFDPRAVSPAGAQGVAQFMPKTATGRGLENPFDPIEAITKSAELLRDLRQQFGNLGLAAAAYNAGAKRVQDWLARRRSLPQETQAYVRIVTGRSADEWITAKSITLNATLPDAMPCPQMAKLLRNNQSRTLATLGKPEAAWGVQLVGNGSESNAVTAFYQLQKKYNSILGVYQPLVIQTKLGGTASWYRVRVGTASREGAEKLCASLRAAGGSCLVQRN